MKPQIKSDIKKGYFFLFSNSLDVYVRRIAILLTTCLICECTYAVDWDFQPSVSVAQSYTDNVRLTDVDLQESDWVTELVPAIDFRGNSPRLNLNGTYQIQGVAYSENSDSNDVFQQLNGRLNSIIIKDLFYLDVTGLYSQRVIDPAISLPQDNLTITTNTTDVGAYSLSPYIRKNIAGTAEATLRYRYDKTNNERTDLSDSTDKQITANILSLGETRFITWNISYENVDRSENDELTSKYLRYALDLDFGLTGKLKLLTTGGYEKNEYLQNNIIDKGSFWNVGFAWNPNQRTQLTIKTGRRYFGKTGFLSISRNLRYLNWSVSYSEEFETSSSLVLNRQIDTEPDEPVTSPGDPGVGTGVFLNKNFSFTLNYNKGKTNADFTIFNYERDYQTVDQQEKSYGANLSWRWRFAQRTELLLRGSVLKSDFVSGISQASTDNIVRLGLTRNLSSDSSLELSYRYLDRDSDTPGNSYNQNLYTLRYNLSL